MLEMDTEACDLEIKHQRPGEMAVAIPSHHTHGRPELPDFRQDVRLADIAEMPDFIRLGDRLAHMRRKPIVRVGNNSNAHH